ncbi:Acyl-CoA synthetase (NDP forming) [Sulfitobacter brevis]|uniref:Acyl-CoA synthetase (NDP forming) n=1 Tax=Sulfitobacter brevis TaxID=74348 RepID=A0A1I2F4N8_9RHOB|nr:acetate--CoA ligase family protein [Sulfitobacter brevis]SFE99827.1 Acyl-CoA synthetase (NDP forming) [Sulfitobacter brevis]
MTPQRRANLQRLLKPRHIAFIGGRYAEIAIVEARRRGFSGQMWAVNPKRREMEGLPCVGSVAELPEPPDAVYLAIPAEGVVKAIQDLAKMGAGGVVCFSAGFKEAGNADAERALIEATGDMALIGPNCYGVINYIDNAALWSFEHGGWSPGYGAAIITQSGMFSSDITMSQRSLPLAYMVSAGNQAVLGQEDFLEVFIDDPAVRAIGLHIEGLQDVARFERAALRALSKGIPVVALKTGSSAIGSELTVSHTGSLSGAVELYEALFARTGVISVTNPSQFLETLKFLCVAGAPKGVGVVGFTCSGGGATMLADHSEKIGLSFPQIDSAQHAQLAALLPDIATVSNPLDYTTPIWGQGEQTYPVFAKTMAATTADTAVLVQDYPAPGLDASKHYYQQDAAAFARAAKEHGVPAAICATLPENMDAATRELLVAEGIAPMQGIHETLNAIAQAVLWSRARECISLKEPLPLLPNRVIGVTTMLTEDKGKLWLSKHGIAVPHGRAVTGQRVCLAAEEVGYPVVLKMMSPQLAHKTDAGAVALNLVGSDALSAAAAQMSVDVKAYSPQAVSDLFLVEEMSPPPLAELVVTLRRDPQFGAALVLGSGGVLVELVGDVVTLLLPASPLDIADALQSLRVAGLLSGFRGRVKADLNKIADQIHRLCCTFIEEADEIAEIEINPLFVYPDRICAVDVLVHQAVGV